VELLKQIPPASGHENGTVQTRSGATNDAGLSEGQRKTALRVAIMNGKSFDEQVEFPFLAARATPGSILRQ
jgi:hypothetical protein